MTKKPDVTKNGSQGETQEEVPGDRTEKHSLTPLQATVELVKRGRREFLPQLREQLKAQPQIWGYVGDLARQTERAWVELIGGSDDLLKESLVLYAEAMRKELAGPDPQPLERLIVERIVSCQLQVLYLDALEAQNDFSEGGKAADYLMRRQNQAHRQLMDATKNLAIVRKLKPAPVGDVTPQPTVPDRRQRPWPSAPTKANCKAEAKQEETPLAQGSGDFGRENSVSFGMMNNRTRLSAF